MITYGETESSKESNSPDKVVTSKSEVGWSLASTHELIGLEGRLVVFFDRVVGVMSSLGLDDVGTVVGTRRLGSRGGVVALLDLDLMGHDADFRLF
jgi:hypothetical protein